MKCKWTLCEPVKDSFIFRVFRVVLVNSYSDGKHRSQMFALDLMLVYLIIVAFCSASMNIVRVFVLRLATPHAPPPTNYRSSSHSMFVMPFANASQSKSVIREKQFSCVHAGTVTRTIASLWSCDFPRAIPGQAPIERKSTRSL